MSRQIPIHVEPGYEATFNASRRASDPMNDDTIPHSFNETDRIENDFEDASRRFFGKNFRRHSELPDHTSWKREFHSPSSPIYEERPFRRGSIPATFSSNSPSYRRNHFDETIQRRMKEDGDSFDFSDPEFGNVHVEKTREKYRNPKDMRTHVKVTKSPSAPVADKRRRSYKFDRQSSTPVSKNAAGDEGFVEIPVIVCKYDKTDEKLGGKEREKSENRDEKKEYVTQDQLNEVLNSECIEKEQDEREINKDDSEFTVKISLDTTAEKTVNDEEEKVKVDEKKEETDLGTQESKKSTEENAEENQTPQESQQNVQLSTIKTIESDLEKVLERVNVFEPTGSTESNKEYLWQEERLMGILMALDAIEANGCKNIREARKAVVKRVQIGQNKLENKSSPSTKRE